MPTIIYSADYYIDDYSNTADIWTASAIGSDANNGQTAGTPKATVTNLLSTYDLGPGDRVFIDTGVYTQRFTISSNDCGSPSGMVLFIGAGTNNTVFNATNKNEGSKLTNISYIKMCSLTIKNANNQNLYLEYSTNSIMSNLLLYNSQGDGLFLNQSDNNTITGVSIRDCVNNGLYLYYGNDYNGIYNLKVENCNRGITIRYSSRNSIVSTTCVSNSMQGIYILSANYNYFTNNFLLYNDGDGIGAPSADWEVFYGNKCIGNKKDGITLYYASGNYCDRNVLERNVCNNNYSNGIHINGSYNQIKSNSIGTNSKDGINHYGANNTISGNSIFSNDLTGIWLGGAQGVVITNNDVFLNGANGIATAGLDDTTILDNRISDNELTGLSFYWQTGVWGCERHIIIGNHFNNNGADGLFIDGKYNYIISNSAYSNGRHGFFLKGDNNFTNNYNITYHNQQDGLLIENITDSLIKHCTSFGNGANGIRSISPTSVTIKNCISVSNNTGYNNFNTLIYSLAYGNTAYDYSMAPGVGCITNNPYFQSTQPWDNNFLFLSGNEPSYAIDTGDPLDAVPLGGGDRVDMGPYEYIYQNTILSISKYCSVSLGGSSNISIPGTTVTYSIFYSNYGTSAGNNIIVYDGFYQSNYISYATNSHTNTVLSWEVQWSTNSTPDQSWSSSDYTNVHPSPDTIKWIRWINNIVGSSEKGYFRYKVFIK